MMTVVTDRTTGRTAADGGVSIAGVDRILDAVLKTGRGEGAPGCTTAEVEQVAADQGVARLPAEYERFLSRAGRGAGDVLRGSDVYFPVILGAKADAYELLRENGLSRDLLPADAALVQTHQGYQLFWMVGDHPAVWFWGEGEPWPSTPVWETFADFLWVMPGLRGPKPALE
jgi:hypothetical protein